MHENRWQGTKERGSKDENGAYRPTSMLKFKKEWYATYATSPPKKASAHALQLVEGNSFQFLIYILFID